VPERKIEAMASGFDRTAVRICYLCGNDLGGSFNRDHVPPRQFFGKRFRRVGQVDDMDWLPTHAACNESYSRDEEYFTATFATVAVNRPAGEALLDDIAERRRQGKQVALSKKVDAELHPVDGSPELARKTFHRNRVDRVVWKIVRGLHFLRTQRYVAERTNTKVWWGHGDVGIPPIFGPVVECASEGKYPQVLDYRVLSERINQKQVGHVYFMVFFDAMIYGLSFEEWLPEIVAPGKLLLPGDDPHRQAE
jgi:hypothetical protein